MAYSVGSTLQYNNTLLSQITGYNIEREEALFRRYARPKQPDLVVEFIRDPGLLHQYYRIREKESAEIPGYATDYTYTETAHDKNGQILVARIGNFCVGGISIASKTPRNPRLLPMEIGSFRLEDYFPDLRHKQISCGEVSNLALLPEFNNETVSSAMMSRLYDKAVAMNLSVLFAASPCLDSRSYRKNCMLAGFKDAKMHYDIELPSQCLQGIKQYLVSAVIDNAVKKDCNALLDEARSSYLENNTDLSCANV